jgi:hypothetical protein
LQGAHCARDRGNQRHDIITHLQATVCAPINASAPMHASAALCLAWERRVRSGRGMECCCVLFTAAHMAGRAANTGAQTEQCARTSCCKLCLAEQCVVDCFACYLQCCCSRRAKVCCAARLQPCMSAQRRAGQHITMSEHRRAYPAHIALAQ